MSYHPQLTITPALLARVEAIAAVRERIQGAAVQVAWIPSLQKDTRARNAHSSTAIEGNPLTLEQVRAVEEGEVLSVLTRIRREVVNYFAALRHIEKQATKKRIMHEDVPTRKRSSAVCTLLDFRLRLDGMLSAYYREAAQAASADFLDKWDIIESLEKKLGKPVVTSNSASMWKMMRLVGDDSAVPGGGRLFREH